MKFLTRLAAAAGGYQHIIGSGWYGGSVGAITGIKILSSSGNIAGGNVETEAWN